MEINEVANSGLFLRADVGGSPAKSSDAALLPLARHPRTEPERALALEQAIQSVGDYAILTLDDAGFVQSWNAGAEALFGYGAPEILGQHVGLLQPRDPWGGFEHAAEAGRLDREHLQSRRDGTTFLAHSVLVAVREAEGQLAGFIQITRDVSAEREAHESLALSEQRHRRLLESCEREAIFLLDASGRIASWNRGVGRILGYSEADFLGQPNARLFEGEPRALEQAAGELLQAAREGQHACERFQSRQDGNRFWASVQVSALHQPGGALLGYSKIIRDNSEQHRSQEALTLARRDLEGRVIERTLELSQAIDLLEEQLIEREQLESALLDAEENERERLGQDLHDGVCQQLTGTAMLAKVLSNSLVRRDAPEAAQALKIVEFITTAVDQARDLAKGLHPVSIHSTRGLVAALEELVERARASQECELHCPGELSLPPTVALHLYRIAQEAVRNALKHAEATRIVLSLEVRPEHLLLKIADNGRGFGAPVADGHSGMGLLNLQYRARAIGAKLSVDSAPDQGTTVHCTLPASRLAQFVSDSAEADD